MLSSICLNKNTRSMKINTHKLKHYIKLILYSNPVLLDNIF